MKPSRSSKNTSPDRVTFCVDPGVDGGIVVVRGVDIVAATAMPDGDDAIADFLEEHRAPHRRMFIEHVTGFIGNPHPGDRMFTFGDNFGFIRGWARGAGVRCERIGPFTWQQVLNLGLRSEQKDRAAWKRLLKKEAERRFPEQSVTLKNADALLIWNFVRTHRAWRD